LLQSLTSISPCPLATNIAAVSFIGRGVIRPYAVVATGVLYALGRTIVYVAIAALLVSSLLSAPTVSHALQKYMNKVMGPLLILVGMMLLGLIEVRTRGSGIGQRVGQRAARRATGRALGNLGRAVARRRFRPCALSGIGGPILWEPAPDVDPV